MQTEKTFDYSKAFDRNLGWLSVSDQEKLKRACVAIAGVGGAGGYQAQALARLGVGRFKLIDPDTFEMTNFNRQMGATMSTLGEKKVYVIRDMIREINPEAQIEIFEEPLSAQTVDSFLKSVDLVMDGIDFFALEAKLLLFEKTKALGLYTVTCCPLGFGASLIVFSPQGMDFKRYFDFNDSMSPEDVKLAFAFGLSPTPLCFRYMTRDALSFKGSRAPSVSPGLMLVGALSATEAVRALTQKEGLKVCPAVFQIDLMTQKMRRKYYPLGMASPWMRLKRWIIRKILDSKKNQA